MRFHCLVTTLVVTLLTVVPPLEVLAAPPPQEANLLRNPGFEEGFSERGAVEVTVANWWEAWWVQGSKDQTEEGYLRRPEYKPEDGLVHTDPLRVHSGHYAQKYFNNHATHIGGIFQVVAVAKGSVVTFSIWVQVWSSTEWDQHQCEGFGNYAVSAGIDPYGGTDGTSGNIVWSEPAALCNQWIHLSVSTVAQADRVTVFTRGAPEFRVQSNNSYWDDASLTAVAPTPQPTNTPRATDTPLPTPMPTITPTPMYTPTPTGAPLPTPTATPPSGAICVLAYHDRNGNKLRDPDEELLPGAMFTLSDARQTVASYISDGVNEPYCFMDLTPGNYFLSEENPPGYDSTTRDDWGVAILGGSIIEIEFGDSPQPTPVPTSTPLPTPTLIPIPSPTPAALLSRLGANLYKASGVIILVLAAAIAIVFNILRRGSRVSAGDEEGD